METKQIINGLLDRADRVEDQSAGRIMKQAAARLKELDQQWIPVTERLPDNMCQCVCRYVFGENVEYPFFQVLWYFANLENPHFQHEGSMGLRVTHWMPLPSAEGLK